MTTRDLVSKELGHITSRFVSRPLTNHEQIVDFIYTRLPKYDPTWNIDYICNFKLPMDVNDFFVQWLESNK